VQNVRCANSIIYSSFNKTFFKECNATIRIKPPQSVQTRCPQDSGT